MIRYFSLFLSLLILTAETTAAGPKDWEKAFSKDNVCSEASGDVVVYYFDRCLVPGPSLEAYVKSAKEADEPVKSEAEREFDEKLKKARENVQRYVKEIEYVSEQLKSLDPEDDQEEIRNLKAELEDHRATLEIARGVLTDLEGKAAKKEQLKEGDDEKPSKASQTGKETHEAFTKKYYNVGGIAYAGNMAYRNINSWLQAGLKWQYANTKIYLVTSQKMWNALKTTSKMFSPVHNVCWDSESQSVLLFASPGIKGKLPASAAFAVASIAFDQALAVMNQKSSEVPDIFSYGLRAKASNLDAVVDLNNATRIELLKEKELLLPAELLNPTRMSDPERCFYFMKQSRAIVDFFGTDRIREFLKSAKGGNSGFRTSYQHMPEPAEWAREYDDFCNNMSRRLFFPLTETANRDPMKLGEWMTSLQQEDKELARRTEERKRRELNKKTGK